jgi:hypothetical protein
MILKTASRRASLGSRQTNGSTSPSWALTALILAAVTGSARASALGDDAATVAPDPAYQAAIASFVNANSEQQRSEALDQLSSLDDASHQRLVRQLLYHSSHADDTKDAMASGLVIQRLGLPDSAVVRALVPLLGTTDPVLDKSVRNTLAGFEGRAAGRRPDLSVYREIIADCLRAGEDPPGNLIQYMYQADPGEALLTLMRAHQLRKPEELKTILWAEHVVSDVIWKQRHGFLGLDEIEPAAGRELASLSGHREWWVRLYAAEIMRQHPAFRQPSLIDKLSRDSHVLVREAVLAADER